MDTLTVALASLGGVVLAGVIAHGAWQARRAGPKQASGPREEPSASATARRDEPGLDDGDAGPSDDPASSTLRFRPKRSRRILRPSASSAASCSWSKA